MYWLTFFLFILFSSGLVAKGQTVQHSALLQNLLADSIAIPNISYEGHPYIDIADKPFNEQPQVLLKNKNGLCVFLNGTGRLYRAVKDEKGVSFQRIDTTRHFGYNIGSFPFSYNDTIYNLGGYGLWRINGQLRMYVEKTRQWDIVKVNKEIPLMYGKEKTLLWYDMAGRKIYTGISTIRDEAIRDSALNETKFIYEVSCLDLVSRNWTKMGNLSSYLRDQISNLSDITSSPWGQLVFSGNKWMLVDFKNNRLLSLSPSKQEKITSTLAPHPGENVFYFKDSVLFAGNPWLNSLDSFSLSKGDFVFANEVVFNPFTDLGQTNKNYSWYLLIGFVVAGACGIWFVFQKKTQKTIRKESTEASNSSSSKNSNGGHHVTFEERELEVLKLVYENSLLAKNTTLEELNKALGISKRNIEIQKKQRSDVITSINRKYQYMQLGVENAIDKKRSEYDGRSFEYFIVHRLLPEVGSLLNSKTNQKTG